MTRKQPPSRIDAFTFKMNSFDTEDFNMQFIAFAKSHILLVFDFDKLVVRHQSPPNLLPWKHIKFHRVANDKWNKILFPFLFFLDMALLMRIFTSVCIRFRPKICWIENAYAAFMVGFLRRLGFCGQSIYFPGDWVVNPRQKSLLSYVGNNLFFPYLDYAASRLNDVVFYGDEKLAQARHRYWGRQIARKETIYSSLSFPGLSIKTEYSNDIRHKICFLGDLRFDSGLDIAIRALSVLWKQEKISLKVIGPLRQNLDYFKKIADECGVSSYVNFLGFLEFDRLKQETSDCFCGINILSTNSFSNYGIPGKQIHYLQFLLPIIATETAGTLVPAIKNKNLGEIIQPTVEAFTTAALKVFENQDSLRSNIVDFSRNLKKIKLQELLQF